MFEMKTHSAIIHRVSNRFGFRTIALKTGAPLLFDPGQYISASVDTGQDDPIPAALFIESTDNNEVSICSPSPERWIPGQQITFRGPLGHGFRIPQLLRRMLLIGLDAHPGRLMAMVQAGIRMRSDVVIAGDFTSDPQVTKDIPPLVELASLDRLTELLDWADFVGLDVPLERIQYFGELIPDKGPRMIKGNIQVLVHTSMPCGGIAECGICSVRTKRGYKLACQDGPVFDLSDLSLT